MRLMNTIENQPPELMTVEQAAELANVSRATLYRRVAAGEVEAVKIGSGPKAPIRIPRTSFLDWIFAEPTREE